MQKSILPGFISRKIEGDYVLWFNNSKHFVQVKEPVWDAVNFLDRLNSEGKAAKEFANLYGIEEKEAENFVKEVVQNFSWLGKETTWVSSEEACPIDFSKQKYYAKHSYRIGTKVFEILYYQPYYKTIIHSLFRHLECNETPTVTMRAASDEKKLWFVVDGYKSWKWKMSENHFLRGRAYLEILRMAYGKEDSDWMSVMHAGAISDGKNSVLVTADSGGGKSTFSALCRVNGLWNLSDDFVPIDLLEQKVHAFPAGTSVKETAYDFMLKYFPELKDIEAVDFNSKKNMRHLPPQDVDTLLKIKAPVKALIFIHYNKKVDFEVKPISTLETLRKVFDQAWLAPNQEHAETFLDWIAQIQCYDLNYSNTEKAIHWVKEILND